MSTSNGTGVDYPTIDLGGKIYTIKWTKAVAYDLSVAGVDLSGVPQPGGKARTIPFHQVVDGLHILIGFEGSKHQLAELIHGRTQEAYEKMMLAAGKIAPSTTKPAAAAADEATPQVQ